jgi:hypothetical protein
MGDLEKVYYSGIDVSSGHEPSSEAHERTLHHLPRPFGPQVF